MTDGTGMADTPLDRWRERVDDRAHKTATTLERVGSVAERTASTLERVAGVVEGIGERVSRMETTAAERRRLIALAGRVARWAIGTALAGVGAYAAAQGII